MANPTMDIRIVAGIVVFAVSVFVVEETLSFGIRRAARLAGAAPTVTRDVGATMRIGAALIVLSDALSLSGFSSLFTGLTVSAVAAVAVSLALQATLSNVISGVLLLNDGLVRLNDDIEYSGTKGKVVRIGLRNTLVRTEHGAIAAISNSSLSSGPLVNKSAVERLEKKYALASGEAHSGPN